jgi:chitodextrinase
VGVSRNIVFCGIVAAGFALGAACTCSDDDALAPGGEARAARATEAPAAATAESAAASPATVLASPPSSVAANPATAAAPQAAAAASAPPRVAPSPRDVTPPSPPSSLIARGLPGSIVELRWEPSRDDVGVAGYELFRGKTRVAVPADPVFLDGGLEVARTHCYTVVAVDGAGNRSKPSAQSCAKPLDTTPPTSPRELAAHATSDRRVALRWAASTDDVGPITYELFRDGRPIFASPAPAAFEDGLAPAREYCYVVRALDAAGNRSADSAAACARTPDLIPPSAPHELTVVARSETELDVAWKASEDDVGVAGYDVTEDGAVTRVDGVHLARTGLRAGTRYCFTASAVDAAGNRSRVAGPVCAATPDRTPPSVPAALVATARSQSSIGLRWEGSRDNVGVVAYEVARESTLKARVTEPAAHEDGLRAATRYCYTVRAVDAAKNRSEPAGPACATTPDTTPPSVPPQLVARPVSETRVELGWRASTDNVAVAGYELLRGDQVVARATATRAAEAGLRAAKEYCYRVRAHDAAGNRSPETAPVCATTLDLTPPSAPDAVRAHAPGETHVELSWAPSTDNGRIDRYEVLRDGKTVASVPIAAASETNLTAATAYCYTVQAIDGAGNRSKPSAKVCATTPDLTPPTAPAELRAAARSETELAVEWTAATDNHRVAGYELLVGGEVVASVSGTSTVVGKLTAGTERCFFVRAFDAAGNRSAERGKACATTPDLTPPSAPNVESAVATSDTAVQLRWAVAKDNVGVAGYEVARDGAVLAKGSALTYADAGLAPVKRYCYRLRAFDAAGNFSAPGEASCVTTPDLKPPTPPGKLTAGLASGKVALGWTVSTDDVGVAGYEVVRDGSAHAKTTERSFVDGKLVDARTYCYAVLAFDAAGNRSPPTAPPICAVAPDVTPPSPPTRLKVVAADRRVDVEWGPATDNVGVAGYEVVRGEVVVATAGAKGTSAREAGLSPWTEYCFAVLAHDASGNRSAVAGPTCVRTPDVKAPVLASALTLNAAGETAVELSWQPATDDVKVESYELKRDGAALATPTIEPKARDEGLSAGKRYCYALRARDPAGNQSAIVEACVTTPDLTPPTVPVDLDAAPTSSEVALRWTKSTDNVKVKGYEVLRGDAVAARPAGVAAFESGLQPTTQYCYRVRALDAAGNRSPESKPLCTKTLDPDVPPTPTSVRIVQTGTASDLEWDASARDEIVYRIYADGNSLGATRYVTFSLVEAMARYRCFRVAAVDTAGRESPWSKESCLPEKAAAK